MKAEGAQTTSIPSILTSIVLSPKKITQKNSGKQDASLHVHENKSAYKTVGNKFLPVFTTGRTRFSHKASQNYKK